MYAAHDSHMTLHEAGGLLENLNLIESEMGGFTPKLLKPPGAPQDFGRGFSKELATIYKTLKYVNVCVGCVCVRYMCVYCVCVCMCWVCVCCVYCVCVGCVCVKHMCVCLCVLGMCMLCVLCVLGVYVRYMCVLCVCVCM